MKSLVQIKAALQAEFQKFPEMDERSRVINAAMMLLKALQNRKNDLRSIENEEFFEGICLDPQNSLGKNGKHAQNLRHNFGETQYHFDQIVNAQNAVFWNVLRSPIHGSGVAKEIIHLIQEYVDALNATAADLPEKKVLRVRAHGGDLFHASMGEAHWGAGHSIAEAIYQVVVYHEETTGIEVEIDASASRLHKRLVNQKN